MLHSSLHCTPQRKDRTTTAQRLAIRLPTTSIWRENLQRARACLTLRETPGRRKEEEGQEDVEEGNNDMGQGEEASLKEAVPSTPKRKPSQQATTATASRGVVAPTSATKHSTKLRLEKVRKDVHIWAEKIKPDHTKKQHGPKQKEFLRWYATDFTDEAPRLPGIVSSSKLLVFMQEQLIQSGWRSWAVRFAFGAGDFAQRGGWRRPHGAVPVQALQRELAVLGATVLMWPEGGSTDNCFIGIEGYEELPFKMPDGNMHTTSAPETRYYNCEKHPKEWFRRHRDSGRHTLRKYCYLGDVQGVKQHILPSLCPGRERMRGPNWHAPNLRRTPPSTPNR
ncbi:uncharacterized protein EV422DRAFT_592718 [Fimicolochytrium jonesii]|uniref:uncharacterized protein n=1 Tax=Fimicolochytrium jonesii TaxID=1396493 RepID=UPI0022FE7921|nr:uncharacterized protein EV422DRAFT_592718 [Fimicolochytrium jonesii]KAI8826597.1 hypothetical protein EV422DRAFT_592718 [Fimicolochytrium jonesii]